MYLDIDAYAKKVYRQELAWFVRVFDRGSTAGHVAGLEVFEHDDCVRLGQAVRGLGAEILAAVPLCSPQLRQSLPGLVAVCRPAQVSDL